MKSLYVLGLGFLASSSVIAATANNGDEGKITVGTATAYASKEVTFVQVMVDGKKYDIDSSTKILVSKTVSLNAATEKTVRDILKGEVDDADAKENFGALCNQKNAGYSTKEIKGLSDIERLEFKPERFMIEASLPVKMDEGEPQQLRTMVQFSCGTDK